jgi:inner membrane protein
LDPLTHALTGAAVAWTVSGRSLGPRALLIGAAAGLLPDVDVFIRSASDPLLAIEHHRGFTHSLVIVPIGGAIAALPFERSRQAIAAGIAAYATHGLLDAATTYGTQLFWPFSRYRVGLDIISIIDPLFTLIMLVGVIAAFVRRRGLVVTALVAALCWLGLGFVQLERASSAQKRLTRSRGVAENGGRRAVFPTVGNTIVWRSIYETDGTLRMDRIRVPWFGPATYAESDSVPALRDQRSHRDLQRFAWFSDDWLARDPSDPTIIGDARYSLRADRYAPVWGIRLHADHTEWVNLTRERKVDPRELWREIAGRSANFRPIPE